MEKEEEELITEQEAQFCLLYTNSPAPLAGDPRLCYKAVYGENKGISEAEARHNGLMLLRKPCVKKRIEELESVSDYNSKSIKLKMTASLMGIIDECSKATVVDRFGTPQSAAPMRAVAVNAIKAVNDMYGIKEDIAHTVNLENGKGGGVVFQINVPKENKSEEDKFAD